MIFMIVTHVGTGRYGFSGFTEGEKQGEPLVSRLPEMFASCQDTLLGIACAIVNPSIHL
jgi:hypothetical protein